VFAIEIPIGQKIFPMHPARRNRDLPRNDRKRARGCKKFQRN
jgi:hypothetical protein